MLEPAAIATPVLLALAGALVLALRPERRLHQLLAALLILRAGFIVANEWAEGATGAQARAALGTAQWYVLGLPVLTLALAATLRPARADRILLVVAGALTAGLALALAFAPSLYFGPLVATPVATFSESRPLVYVVALLAAAADATLVLRAAQAAASAPDTAASRTAGALGLAACVFPVYAAASFATLAFVNPDADVGFALRAGAAFGVVAVVALALPRLLRPFAARAPVVAGLALLAALGAFDPLVTFGVVPLPGYARALGLVRLAYAILVVGAVLRFGLADAGAAARRRTHAAVRAALVAGAAVAAALVGVALLGANAVGGVAGVAIAGVVGGAAWRPAERPARWIGAQLLLAPDDPRAVAERARAYAAAVAASKGAGAEGERLLAAMRADLDISEKEHELLAQGLASREAARYQRVEVLGSGATATVELAVDEVAGRRVVVKRFKGVRDPAAALREARALAAVKHPRVVPFLEVDRRDDAVYLVLAYAEGGSARQLLDREGPLPPARAVGLALDLLDGLDALHAQGIVHGDVKPENLLLDRDGRGMLGDFGSARFQAPDLADATLTGGAAEGSLSTISPEALRGAAPAPARDVYAAGALLYRLLTGQHHVALEGATVFEARERILLDAPRLPHPQVPRAIEDALRRALAKKPGERFGSAREMRDALARALAHHSV